MTTRTPSRAGTSTHLLRRLLLALMLAVAVSVAWTYRRSSEARPEASTSPSPVATPGDSRTENLVFKKFDGERQRFALVAREMVGKEEEEWRLRGVNFTFSYVSQGSPGNGTVVSDECIYTPTLQRAVFQGHVVVTTQEGFTLRTESLIYRGDKSLAKSEQHLEFERKDVRGRSTGFTYVAEEGRLELPADVVVRVQDEGNPATEIRAARALLLREEKTLRFGGGVTVSQGNDVLKCDSFEADFGDDHVIYRARAIENVDLQTSGVLPGTAGVAGASGARHLRCRKLDLWFRSNRTLQEATAGPDADLLLLPGPKDPPERRRLHARFLAFTYDEQGRLREVRGQKESAMAIEPIPPAKGTPRHLSCQSFLARLDPATGSAQYVEFTRDVGFVEGRRKATSQKAYYDGATAVLSLKEDPELIDQDEGSHLSAEAIDLNSRNGDLAARHRIRHVLTRKGGGGGLLSSGSEPLLVTSRFLDYDGQTRLARYREEALLRTGKDEVRAPEIRLQDKDGQRRLEATGGAVSLLHPRRDDEGAPPAPVEARAREMVFEEAHDRLAYTGEVLIRQGQVSIRAPQAMLHLTSDGRDLKTLVAGEPVEVQQGDRKGRAARATYDPRAGTMTLVGDKVTLTDPRQQVQGRAVTFNLSDDRVIVDGQEQARTQTIIRSRRESAPPETPRQEPPRP